jgi:hypothetical protein
VSRTVVPACLLVAGVILTGCSAKISTDDADASSSAAAPSSAAPSSDPATTPGGIPIPTVSISGLPGGGSGTGTATVPTGGAALPPGFPLPPGAKVTRSADDGGEIAATLTVPDPAAATSFWKSALPRAGYTITSDESVGGFGEIRFSGHGCGGNSQLALQGATVALQCDRG